MKKNTDITEENSISMKKNGNLRKDSDEQIELEWTMAGKLKKVINTVNTNTKAEYLYDAMGLSDSDFTLICSMI
jgi:hypothetical protein